MIVVLLLVLLAVGLTWVLFRDGNAAGKASDAISGAEPGERERRQPIDE
jgi:hypothetical protein